jgi:hypothetical protein
LNCRLHRDDRSDLAALLPPIIRGDKAPGGRLVPSKIFQ